MMKHKGILALSSLAFAALLPAASIQIDANRSVGEINHALGGVSQGGNAGSYFKPELAAGLEKLAPQLVRIEMITSSLPHKLYDPATGKFNWELLDREIETIQKSGGEVIINFFGTPEHLASNPKAPVPAFTPPTDPKAYADFCAEIVRHVNLEKKYNVKLWEFWNEPSGNYFWTDWHNNNHRSFFELWNEVYRAVKKVDPSSLMGGFADNSQYPEHYEAWFDFVKKSRTEPDFLTIHYYGDWAGDNPTEPANYTRFSDRLLEICRKKFGKTLPLYYTEWNLPAESVNRFPAEQVAAWIGASLNEMQKNGRIDGAAFFRIEHYRDPYSSLFDQNGTPRTAFRVLHFFDTMPERALTVRTDELPGVTVTAAGSRDEVALLIARYDATKDAATLNTDMVIRNLAPNRTYQLEISRENVDNAAKTGEIPPQNSTIASSASGTIQLPLELAPFDTLMIRLHSGDGNRDGGAVRN